jgi:hypothetical protein
MRDDTVLFQRITVSGVTQVELSPLRDTVDSTYASAWSFAI